LLHSHSGLPDNYSAAVALDYLAEIPRQLLAPTELDERYFRPLLAVIEDRVARAIPRHPILKLIFAGTSSFRAVRRLSWMVLEGPVLSEGRLDVHWI
jgi:hypothetical protein